MAGGQEGALIDWIRQPLLRFVLLLCLFPSQVLAIDYAIRPGTGLISVDRDAAAQPDPPAGGAYTFRASQQSLTGYFIVGLYNVDGDTPDEPDAPLAVELVAFGPGMVEEDRLRVGDYQQLVRNSIFPPAFVFYHTPFSGGGITEWTAVQRDLNRTVQVHVIIDPDNVVAESDESNNLLIAEFPNQPGIDLDLQVMPLSDRMFFGSGGHVTQIVDITAENVAACTDPSKELEVSGPVNLMWDGSPSDNWADVPMSISAGQLPRCMLVQFDAGSSLYDLVEINGIATSTSLVAGQLAGLNAEFTILYLIGPNPGRVVGVQFVVDLPPGHSYHEDDGNGRPLARGQRKLNENVVDWYGDLDSFSSDFDPGHLQVRGLPFDLAISSLTFNSVDFTLTGDATSRYAHDQAYDIWDPRNKLRDGVTSNDRRFSKPDTQTLTFVLDGAGLDVQLQLLASDPGEDAPTHFPRTRQTWGDFSLDVADGAVVPGAILPAESYTFTQSTACAECPANAHVGVPFQLSPGANPDPQGISADGATLARFASIGANAKWGPFDFNLARYIYERLNDAGRPGVLYLPGFLVPGSGGGDPMYPPDPVVPALMGMRRANPVLGNSYLPGNLYELGGQQATRGNYFMAGLTVGPEVYHGADVFNPVEAGAGSDLAGSTMRIAFGGLNSPDYETLTNNPGAKYVVRPGGVTGVFNTDSPPQPDIYGYDFSLDRFAFRQVNSTMDRDTWIDGNVSIPAPGDFTVVFESLEILCTGDVGEGFVVREACDQVNNNGNAYTDEGCEVLGAWQADFRVLSMEFKPPNPNAEICAAGDRNLWVGSTVDLVALRDLLGLYSGWENNGQPLPGAQVTGGTEQVLDAPAQAGEFDGFNAALGNGVDLVLHNNQSQGWFRFHDAAIELPFWDTLSVGMRVQNSSTTSRANTIILGEANGALDDTGQNNNGIIQKDVSDLDSVYTWGATGFGISLPIYYDSSAPRFLGDVLSYNLLVLDANANTDYITADETKVSFGASADLNSINIGGVPISLNPNDPSSFLQLATYGIGQAVEAGMTELANKVNLMNESTGNNMDGFIEDGLRDTLGGLNQQPYADLADSLGRVGGVPGELIGQMVGGIDELTRSATQPLTVAAADKVDDLINDLPPLLNDALNGLPVTANDLNAQLETLQAVRGAVSQVRDGMQNALGDLNLARDDLEDVTDGLLQEISSLSSVNGALDTARDSVISGLDQALGISICNDAINPVVRQVDEIQQRVDDVRNVLEQIPLEEIGAAFSSQSDVDLSAVSSARQQIQDLARDISDRITEARNIVDGVVGCNQGSLVDTFGADVEGFLGDTGQLATEVSGIAGQLGSALDDLLGAVPGDTGKLGQLADKFGVVYELAGGFVNDLDRMERDINLALEYAANGTIPHYEIGEDATAVSAFINDKLMVGTANIIDYLRGKTEADIDLVVTDISVTAATALPATLTQFPNATTKDIQGYVSDLVMNNPAIGEADQSFSNNYTALLDQSNNIQNIVFDQVNNLLQTLILQAGGALADAINNSNDSVGSDGNDWNMPTFKMDGYALIAGDDLQQLHVGLDLSVPGGEEQDSFGFGASLDVTRWTANGKDQGCSNVDAASRLDVIIAAYDLPIFLGTSTLTLQKAYLGFTLDEKNGPLLPVQVTGGILMRGSAQFGPVAVFDPGAVLGGGDVETFFGARVGATFDSTTIQVAFLVGRICNNDPLLALDPQAAEFIEFPPQGGFTGGYVRGSASTTIINYGCPLQLGASADVGNWLFIGDGNNPTVFGGIVGGGVFGKAACIVSIRGQITIIMNVAYPNLTMAGETFFVGGLGFCNPSSWTTVPRSRDDDIFCGTVDATLGASATVDLDSLFNGGGSGAIDFQIDPPEFGAIH